MLLLIPLLPFLGFVVNAFFGKRLPKSVSSVTLIGQQLFTRHAFAFEATSILILVAMVGAVVLARREH